MTVWFNHSGLQKTLSGTSHQKRRQKRVKNCPLLFHFFELISSALDSDLK